MAWTLSFCKVYLVLFNGDFLPNVQTVLENLANIYLMKPTKLCFYILGYILTYLQRASGLFFFKSQPNFKSGK